MTDYDRDVIDSGPFCRHWSDPADCEEPCDRCGHACKEHGGSSCGVEGCSCNEFENGLCVRCCTEHMHPSSAKEHEDLCPACWIACSKVAT